MAETFNEYLSRVSSERDARTAAAAQLVIGSVEDQPDALAGDLNLANDFAKVTGNPVPPTPLVKEYRNVFQQKIEEAKNATVLSRSPKLSDWLRDPENAAVARDDLDNLSWFELVGKNIKEVAKGIPGGAVSAAGTSLEGAGQLLTPRDAVDRLPLGTAISQAKSKTPEEIAALRTQIFNQGVINPQFAQSVLSDVLSGDMTPQDAMAALEPMFAPALDAASKALQKAGEATQDYGGGILPADPGMEESFGREVGAGLGSLVTLIGASFLPGGIFTSAGVAASMGAGEATANARKAGQDEDTQTVAAMYGILPGLTDIIPMERLLANPATKAGLASFLRSIGAQTLLEGGQEAAQQTMQNTIAQVLYAPDKSILDDVMRSFQVGGVVGAISEVGKQVVMAALPGKFHKARASADRAAETVQQISEISTQANASKLRARLPDRFRQFLEGATSGTDIENVFIPAEDFVQYFQGAGIDPFSIAAELEGVTRDDLETALAGGGDLKIPTATYAAKIAGTDADPFFMENMRFDPDEFTAREAAEFNARADDVLQEAWEAAEAVRMEREELRSMEDQIYDRVVSRLRVAGRSTDVATNEAALYAAFYRTMAERAGMTTGEFMARYPLPEIRGDLPTGMQLRDVDALNRTLAEARNRRAVGAEKRGPTLTEWIADYGGINDVGGELKNMGAETVSRGKGKKSLRLARQGVAAGARDLLGAVTGSGKKHGVDDVARAAIEAGYLANDPIANEYRAAMIEGREVPDIGPALWDAIAAELRGDVQYATEADPSAAEHERMLDEIEGYLSGLGVSLDDDDATIRQAMEGAREYAQGAPSFDQFGAYSVSDGDLYRDGDKIGTIKISVEADARTPHVIIDDIRITRRGEGTGTDVIKAIVAKAHDSGLAVGLTSEAMLGKAHQKRLRAYYERIGFARNTGINKLPGVRSEFILPAPRSYAQPANVTQTEAFKRWFGDSKVVDENGRPLVVYHGTKADFEAFDPGRTGTATDFGWFGDGIYTTPNKRDAEGYAKGGQVLALYVKMENPFVTDNASLSRGFIEEVIKPDGYDGIMFYNRLDDDRPDEIIAFSPEQIKSVNNSGSFDPKDARIYYQPAYHGSPHLFDKFSTSQIGKGEGNQSFGWGLYFASKKEVAEWYRNALTRAGREFLYKGKDVSGIKREDVSREEWAGLIALSGAKSVKDAIASQEAFASLENGRMREYHETAAAWLKVADIEEVGIGRTYQVEIPNDDDLMDFDRPLSEQPDKIQEAFKSLGIDSLNITGGEAYTRIASSMGKTVKVKSAPLGWGIVGDVFATKARVPDHKAASEALSRAGIPGHRYVGTESQSTNYVIYDDTRVSVASYEQSGNLGPRGLIQFPPAGVGKGDTIIRLFQGADLSTFLHETGHYFLTVMRDMADKGGAPDFEAVKAWWRDNAKDVARDGRRVMPDVHITEADVIAALDAGTTGDVLKDAAVDVGMQEQFARGFEAYLMEGKAPSADLRGAFEKFRAWLISVYQKLAGLNVSISADLRNVFDRMIATDEEIANARADTGDSGPVFTTAEQMGLTQEEYDAFLKLRSQSEDEAKARLLRETMAPVKRAQEKWFKEERAKVREEVEAEINRLPYFRAIEWMGNRRWFGEDKPEDMADMRLSKSVLVDRYGEVVLKTLPRGKQTVYMVDGGLDPDDAAGWFGFDSGDEMIRAMERAPNRKEAIEAETDRVMRERHGDALNDGAIEAEAMDAVHTDKKAQWIAAELKAVVEIAGTGVGMTAKDARASAKTTIARMRVRDAMAANRFLAAERKAADEAARLAKMLGREGVWMANARRRIATKARAAMKGKGTVEAVPMQIERAVASSENYNETVAKLIETKRRQLINHALYTEARRVADEVEKAEGYINRLTSRSKREKIAGAGRRENASIDYLSAIDEILERYDFRKLSGKAEQRRGSLNAFVEGMKAAGRENEIAIPDAVLKEAARRPYKTLPVEELRGVIDSLKNLEHIALRWNKLIDAKNEREFEATVDEIAAEFEANMPKRPPGRVGTTGEGIRNSTRQFFNLVLNAGTILREIDGFKDLGAAYRNIKSPIDEAMNRLTVRKEKAAHDLEALYSPYSKDERRRMAVREHMPELGYALSKWERIAVALNTGNAGNLQRLTDKRVRGSLTETQVQAVLATLDARDADFIQSVWDYVGTFKDDIASRERRTTGVEPDWVEASPVVIAGKTLKGGYYPLKYDPRLSSLARDDEVQEIANTLQAGRFGKAQTRNGHTKERGQSSGRDVQLDMSVLHRHVNQVIYDLELSEPVSNAWRIIQSGKIRSAFSEAGRQADFDALEIWLKDVAEGELRSADLVGRTARMMKSNFTAAKLAFNLSTVAMQITGLSQTMVVVGKKDFANGIVKAFRPGVPDEIAAKSPFMATRQTTFNKDIYDFYTDPKSGPVATRWGELKQEIIGPLSFWLMTKVQWHLVDVPTWVAGYQQGLRKFGNNEAKAIAHADSIVKRAQASGLFSDRSAIERGSVTRTARQNDVVRLFTTLGSYMFAKFNVAYERTGKARRVFQDEGMNARSLQEALSWTLDMAFLFTVEAAIAAAIKGRLPDDDDEDDEGWLAFLAKETAFSVMGTIPGVRDVSGPLQGFDGGGAYGGITKEIAAPFSELGKSIEKGEVRRQFVKSVISATGLATGIPATQINRAVDAAWRQGEGDDVSPFEYLLGRMGK